MENPTSVLASILLFIAPATVKVSRHVIPALMHQQEIAAKQAPTTPTFKAPCAVVLQAQVENELKIPLNSGEQGNWRVGDIFTLACVDGYSVKLKVVQVTQSFIQVRKY